MSSKREKKNASISKLPLTARQREVLEFIRRCVRKRGFGPTVREIGEEMGIHSPNGVVGHLTALSRKGYIQRERNLSRSIVLVERVEKNASGLPILAYLKNGKIKGSRSRRCAPISRRNFAISATIFSFFASSTMPSHRPNPFAAATIFSFAGRAMRPRVRPSCSGIPTTVVIS
jgi:hypothetical protein